MTAPLQNELMKNALLAKLRDGDRQRLVPHMMRTDLRAQVVLQRAGEDVVHTWFPCGSASAAFRVWIDEKNPAVEVALVGSEGAIGGIVSNGNVPAFATCHVQAGGTFLRVKTAALEQCKLELDCAQALVLALFGLPARSDISDCSLQRDPHDCATHRKVVVGWPRSNRECPVRNDPGSARANAGGRTHLCGAGCGWATR